jgi:lipoprotein-anchoring transpeptidase ErfK/SrfK
MGPLILLMATVFLPRPAAAALSKERVNSAQLKRTIRSTTGVEPAVVKAQVLLDRAFLSPGVIDGRYGGNLKKALIAFQYLKKLPRTGALDARTWKALTKGKNAAVLTPYTITADDVNGPFVPSIPGTLKKKAKLKSLSYTTPRELLAEKFHMDEHLLQALNPRANFKKAGVKIVVANVRGAKPSGQVASIIVDRKLQAVKPHDKNGKLIAFYPATVGSRDFPSPSGDLKVKTAAELPVFTYSSELQYADLKPGEVVRVPPGPNNPVGIVWIDLNKKGYGIHGTPEPAKISKNESHGCVRLTNWDAMELAQMVRPGVPVKFVE